MKKLFFLFIFGFSLSPLTLIRAENAIGRSPAAGGIGRTRIVRQGGHPIPQHHAIVGNSAIVRSMRHDRRVEIVPNRAYWHTAPGGIRYVHTYRGGIHWYGFYHGSNFYWTRYHRNHWWWYDPGFNHWVFWANGFWWWNGPGGVLYVYENDGYTPYDQVAVRVTVPAAAPALDAADDSSPDMPPAPPTADIPN